MKSPVFVHAPIRELLVRDLVIYCLGRLDRPQVVRGSAGSNPSSPAFCGDSVEWCLCLPSARPAVRASQQIPKPTKTRIELLISITFPVAVCTRRPGNATQAGQFIRDPSFHPGRHIAGPAPPISTLAPAGGTTAGPQIESFSPIFLSSHLFSCRPRVHDGRTSCQLPIPAGYFARNRRSSDAVRRWPSVGEEDRPRRAPRARRSFFVFLVSFVVATGRKRKGKKGRAVFGSGVAEICRVI